MAGVATSTRQRSRIAPYLMILPALAYLGVFYVVPFYSLLRTSLSTMGGSVYLPELTFAWNFANYGQALTEYAVYDSDSGQLVTGSFMDYGMPRAHNMPVELREAVHTVPSTTNPLGVKGTGEAGTTAAIAAVMNAVANAIPNGAADHMEMPATPSKVWAAVQKGMAAGK